MYITNLKIDGYKNLENINFSPSKNFNVILGKNAQGKTNLLEAIWIMTGCRSFRNSKEKDYIGFNKQEATVQINFEDNLRQQDIYYKIIKGNIKNKNIKLNEVPLKNGNKLFENFKCIAFLPDDIDYVKGSPEKRRVFIDLCYSQLKPKALNYIRKNDILINQRNTVLKNIFNGFDDKSNLFIWDQQLAIVGAYISLMRNNYVKKLNNYCNKLYNCISNNNENLEIKYQSNVYNNYVFPDKVNEEMVNIYLNKLSENIKDDIRLGYTQIGVNRDDLVLKINNLSVKDFGSQGQQKSTAFVMKLAQASIYKEETDESPIILLDDIMSELDEQRQSFVYDLVKEMQVFITTCNIESVRNSKAKVMYMSNGKLNI